MYANREGFENIKTILTIHNIQYQGVYGYEILDNVVGISTQHASLLENNGAINFMKGGIECSNLVTPVSPTYCKRNP
jgi:starch synthase